MTGAAAMPIRIVLVDDHAVVRAGLRLLIESRPCCLVVGEAGNVDDAVTVAAAAAPDLVVLDLDLGKGSGLDCLPRIREVVPACRVLVLTGLRDQEAHQQAMRLGAAGVLVKDRAADCLLKAIDCVHAGETWLDRVTTAVLLAELAGGARPKPPDPERIKMARLSSRERELVELISEGLRNEEIADRLHISEATVRHHLTSIFGKLELRDRLALTIYAFRHGLVKTQ